MFKIAVLALALSSCATVPTERSQDATSTTVCIMSWCALNEALEGDDNKQREKADADLELVP